MGRVLLLDTLMTTVHASIKSRGVLFPINDQPTQPRQHMPDITITITIVVTPPSHSLNPHHRRRARTWFLHTSTACVGQMSNKRQKEADEGGGERCK